MMVRILMMVAVAALASVAPAAPQISPPAKVYRSQYGDLRTKSIALLERARDSREDTLALQQERLALVKLIHRLQEEAMRENAERARRGQPSDKSLLLVSQACAGLDFMLLAVDSYIDTGDRAFLQLARQAIALMDLTEQFF